MNRFATLFILIIILLASTLVAFGPNTSDPRDLPPRPTPIPPDYVRPNISKNEELRGLKAGHIVLPLLSLPNAQSSPDRWWTVVQWQDSQGNWHDVDGWRGHMNIPDSVMWWVSQANFGEGPFRWVIYDTAQRNTILSTSNPFSLPDQDGEILVILTP